MSDSEKPDEDEPKLVVDTDWKEQVAREKEQAEVDDAAADESPASPEAELQPSDGPADESADGSADDGLSDDYPAPPPASFEVLVSMMFTQAMAMLGQMPDPSTGEATVNKPYAKHYIDTMEMLDEKTQGNLTDEEKKILSEALHALRMMYVNVKG